MDGLTRDRRRRARSWRRCSTRRPRSCRAARCCWRRATTSARRRRTRRCSRTSRRSTSRTRGGSTPRASATTSSTSASSGSCAHEARANFPFLSANIVDEDTGEAARLDQAVEGVPRQRRARRRHRRDGQDDARAREGRRHRGAEVPRRGRSASARSPQRLRALGVKVQIVVIHEGAALGANAIDGKPAAAWEGPIMRDRPRRCRTRPSTSSSPGTRTGSRTRWSGASRWSRASTPAAATRWPS